MSSSVAFVLLLVAALLEAAGDAFVRVGLHGNALLTRIGFILLGGLILTTYGMVVNAPPWDFGKLLGIYVTLFFLAAQLINLIVFHGRPDMPRLVGGGLILAGGLLMTFWRPA